MKKKERKKRHYKGNPKKKIVVLIILGTFLFVGMGFSILDLQFDIGGTLEVGKYDKTLYGVLRKNVKTGDALKYTGNHQDSMDPSKSTENIYYWHAENDNQGEAINNKNNVIFANMCWHMIRTTDTGGVKLIYNGIPSTDGKCTYMSGNRNSNVNRLYFSYTWISDAPNDNVHLYATKIRNNGSNLQLTGTINNTTKENIVNQNYNPRKQFYCNSDNCTSSAVLVIDSDRDTRVEHNYGDQIDFIAMSAYFDSRSIWTYNALGPVDYNRNHKNPSDVGYMYNSKYPVKDNAFSTKGLRPSETLLKYNTTSSLSNKYATSYSYDPNTEMYTLIDPFTISDRNDFMNAKGKYTCWSNTSCKNLLYVADVVPQSSSYNYADHYSYVMSKGDTNNHTFTYGDSYQKNNDGTYTILTPTTITYDDIRSLDYDDMKGKYVCKDAVNDTCSDVWSIASMGYSSMQYYKSSNEIKYAKSFTYDENTNTYTLSNDSVSFWNFTDENKASLNRNRYTCWNDTGTCNTISYLISEYNGYRYLDIENGLNISDVLNYMLTVNEKDSIIKTTNEAWYRVEMLDNYDSYIEDTIFCNDRRVKSLGTFDPEHGNLGDDLVFKQYDNLTDLSCSSVKDQFSTLNNEAKLEYKVGMLTSPEANLLNSYKILRMYNSYKHMSPAYFDSKDSTAYAYTKSSNSSSNNPEYQNVTNYNAGMRPVISLRKGIKYSSGNGSIDTPYRVDMNS